MAESFSSPENVSANTNATATMTEFDLETYIGRYNATSETRLQRLLFIGEHSTDPSITTLAYELAERQMKETGNVRRYKEIFGPRRNNGDGGNSSSFSKKHNTSYDMKWLEETDAMGQAQLDVLEGRLSSAQSRLNKEAIRAAFLALGEFHRKRGELRDGLRAVTRSREYCTHRNQTGHVCLLIIEMALDCRDYGRVRDYVAKAEHTNIEGDIHFPSKPRVAAGLLCLAEGRYQDAAKKFTSITGPPLENFDSVVSTEDVALYGALLALATMDRSELCSMLEPPSTSTKNNGSNNLSSLAAGLELVPPIQNALRHFSRAEYKLCLDVLEQLKPQLLLDLYLSPHVTELLNKIRDKCLVEHLKPYCRVELNAMAQHFGLEANDLLSILAKLIQNGHVENSRIDCRTLTLTRETNTNHAQSARRRVSQLSDRVLNDAHAMVIRLACLEQDLVVKNDRRGGGGEAGSNQAFWNRRPEAGGGGGYDIYDGDESSDDGDTPMVDLIMADRDMNPEDLY